MDLNTKFYFWTDNGREEFTVQRALGEWSKEECQVILDEPSNPTDDNRDEGSSLANDAIIDATAEFVLSEICRHEEMAEPDYDNAAQQLEEPTQEY